MWCEYYMSARYHSGGPRQEATGSIFVLACEFPPCPLTKVRDKGDCAACRAAISDSFVARSNRLSLRSRRLACEFLVSRPLAGESLFHDHSRLRGIAVVTLAAPSFGKSIFGVEGHGAVIRLANL